MMEQIKKYSKSEFWWFTIKEKILNSCVFQLIYTFWRYTILYLYKTITREVQDNIKSPIKVCVVPLPYFNTYIVFPEGPVKIFKYIIPEDQPKGFRSIINKIIPEYVSKRFQHSVKNGFTYKNESTFDLVGLDQTKSNIFRQGNFAIESMLRYKWKQFAMYRFIWMCFIHVIYYVSFTVGVVFSQDLFHQDNKEGIIHAPGQIISILLMIIAALNLIFKELRQFVKAGTVSYCLSLYNQLNLASYYFPMFVLLELIFGIDFYFVSLENKI